MRVKDCVFAQGYCGCVGWVPFFRGGSAEQRPPLCTACRKPKLWAKACACRMQHISDMLAEAYGPAIISMLAEDPVIFRHIRGGE